MTNFEAQNAHRHLSIRSCFVIRISLFPNSVCQSGKGRWRVHFFQDLPFPEIHVDSAREARIEAANRAHDIDALEFIRAILLKYRRVLHGIFVQAQVSRRCREGSHSTGLADRDGNSRSCLCE